VGVYCTVIKMQLVGLLTLVILFLSVIAEPSILLRKNIGFPEGTIVPTVGKEMIVSLQIFNIGTNSGYDVTVNDVWYDFELSSGLESVKWEEVPAGANYTHTFVIIPIKSGDFKARRATLLYKDSNGISHETLSNEPYLLRIYELNEVDKRAGAHLIEWVGFFFFKSSCYSIPSRSLWIYKELLCPWSTCRTTSKEKTPINCSYKSLLFNIFRFTCSTFIWNVFL